MRSEVLETVEALREIQPQWRDLVDRMPGATPFQHPAWLLTWWKHFGGGALGAIAIFDHTQLCGFVPCFLHEWNSHRQLTLIGSGVTDYLEPPILVDAAEEIGTRLASLPEWQVIDWQDLNAETPLANLPSVQIRPDTPCMELLLPGTFEDFVDRLGKDLRRNCRRYAEKARREGAVSFHVSHEARPELLDALVTLHARRWEQRGEAGMIAVNRSEAFLRNVAVEFAREDMLRIFSLKLDDRIVAVILGFLYRKRLFGYMSAFDPQQQHIGFGRLLMFEALRHCFEQNYTAWNFLRGEEAYKFAWGASVIPKVRLYKSR